MGGYIILTLLCDEFVSSLPCATVIILDIYICSRESGSAFLLEWIWNLSCIGFAIIFILKLIFIYGNVITEENMLNNKIWEKLVEDAADRRWKLLMFEMLDRQKQIENELKWLSNDGTATQKQGQGQGNVKELFIGGHASRSNFILEASTDLLILSEI